MFILIDSVRHSHQYYDDEKHRAYTISFFFNFQQPFSKRITIRTKQNIRKQHSALVEIIEGGLNSIFVLQYTPKILTKYSMHSTLDQPEMLALFARCRLNNAYNNCTLPRGHSPASPEEEHKSRIVQYCTRTQHITSRKQACYQAFFN